MRFSFFKTIALLWVGGVALAAEDRFLRDVQPLARRVALAER